MSEAAVDLRLCRSAHLIDLDRLTGAFRVRPTGGRWCGFAMIGGRSSRSAARVYLFLRGEPDCLVLARAPDGTYSLAAPGGQAVSVSGSLEEALALIEAG